MPTMRDPRIQQTFNQISSNFDSVTDNARAGCFTFTKAYLEPCLHSLSTFSSDLCSSCGSSQERTHNRRRSQYAFDFYNPDYDEDDIQWGTDELDRLLAGSGSVNGGLGGGRGKPGGRNEGMYYTRSGQRRKRKGSSLPPEVDPTVIPNTSPFGFMSLFRPPPVLRYKPSAANLQDHPGGYGGVNGPFDDEEGVLGGEEDAAGRRPRSGTVSSEDTYRSRTDLFPSEDEDDAVPLDDEFADTLGLVRKKKGKKGLRRTRTVDTEATSGSGSASGGRKTPNSDRFILGEEDVPGDEELRLEEEAARREEEEAVEMKRQAANKLALQRGLNVDDLSIGERSSSIASSTRRLPSISSPRSIPVEPVVMKDMGLEDPGDFSPLSNPTSHLSPLASPRFVASFAVPSTEASVHAMSPPPPAVPTTAIRQDTNDDVFA